MDINGWNVDFFLCIMRLKGDSILPFNPVGQIKPDPDSKTDFKTLYHTNTERETECETFND